LQIRPHGHRIAAVAALPLRERRVARAQLGRDLHAGLAALQPVLDGLFLNASS
jgi:hypothetical protein